MRCGAPGSIVRGRHQVGRQVDPLELLAEQLAAHLALGVEQVGLHGREAGRRAVERHRQGVGMGQVEAGATCAGQLGGAGDHPVAGEVERGSGDDIANGMGYSWENSFEGSRRPRQTGSRRKLSSPAAISCEAQPARRGSCSLEERRTMITLKCLGAAGTVTGSKHLVEVGDFKILIDCGLVPGPQAAAP